jgi:hypothetical protein
VKTKLKPANSKARILLKKLQALAERGIDGEKTVARRKLARLKARFDFSGPDPAETIDLFSGRFDHSNKGQPIHSFGSDEFDVANSVKWAIESATKIRCVYRGGKLMAEATPATARKLHKIARHIASSFRALVERFSRVEGVSAADRGVFVMGLYDGMMNETREVGQPLPSRPSRTKRRKGRKPPAPSTPLAAGLHIHPYTLAVGLGRQIRFAAPLEQIAAELEMATQRCLAQEGTGLSGDQVRL